ncbi:MAG: ABC transporter substrate-binding protein [Phycisphaerales bacterium]
MRPLLLTLIAIIVAAALVYMAALSGRAAAPAPASTAPPDSPRIVVLSPGLADILRACDFGPALVGRHAFDAWSDSALPVCGDQSGINYEALIAARPTHVLIEWGQRDLPPRLVELATANKWLLKNYPLLTLADIQAAADDIQVSVPPAPHPPGTPGITPAARRLRDRFDAAFARRDGLDQAGRILILYSAKPPTVLGPGSFHHQILERLGATPAITEGKPFITLDAEDVLRLKPDGIILIQPRAAGSPAFPTPRDVGSLKDRLGAVGMLDIPAVRNGHIALIDDETAALPGPSLAKVGDELAEILAVWARQAGDPAK